MKAARSLFVVSLLVSVLWVPTVFAATAAGTSITNTATLTYIDSSNTARTVVSNTTSFDVDEVLDVTVVSETAGAVNVATPETDARLIYRVTNTGNGQEKYDLTVVSNLSGDDFDPTSVRIYVDNSDGSYDPASDRLHTSAADDPVLDAGKSVLIYVISNIPSGLTDTERADVRLEAISATAKTMVSPLVAGDFLSGAGDSGTFAVVGVSLAQGNAQASYQVNQYGLALNKTFAISHPTLATKDPIPGSHITYKLELVATGSGRFTNIIIGDTIPTNTTYVPNSLTLNGRPLGDDKGGDEGYVNGLDLRVMPNGRDDDETSGYVDAPSTYVVSFTVAIN